MKRSFMMVDILSSDSKKDSKNEPESSANKVSMLDQNLLEQTVLSVTDSLTIQIGDEATKRQPENDDEEDRTSDSPGEFLLISKLLFFLFCEP